jgi:hypothetical protein
MSMKALCCFGIALGTLSACGPSHQPQELANNESAPVLPAPSAPPAVANDTAPAPPSPGQSAEPVNRTSLPEPKGPIDPKSVEAAGQVVQHYGALIEQHRMTEAAKQWGSADSAQQFALQLKRYPEAHLEIGDLGQPEGAAGSIYVTMPVVFYGKDQNDKAFRRPANMILRRVNDVPGSTEAQRRWHIERIEWKNAA